MFISPVREQDFPTLLKNWLSNCNQAKRKIVVPHITHLMFSLLLLLTISLQLVVSYRKSSFHLYLFSLLSNRCCLTEIMARNFPGPSKSRFGDSEKELYILKIPKLQHKLVREYKVGELVSHFLNNVAKACLHGLKISENIEIKHVVQSKTFFISVTVSKQVASRPLKSGLFHKNF